jgi:putative nucleotidyltransferase with HDIG domain
VKRVENKGNIRQQMLKELRVDFDRVYHSTLSVLTDALESRSKYMIGHSERVRRYADMIAQKMGLSEEEKNTLSIAAILHDIGTLKIDEAIWNKPGKLTEKEYEKVKKHSAKGAEMLSAIGSLESVIKLIRSHHENFDGQGYPDGLKGEKIPLGSRILAVAEVFDALTSDRSYRKRLDPDIALEEIKGLSGSQFDPEIVGTFVSAWRELYG